MADNVTNELIYETLKAMQGQLARIAEDMRDMKSDARAHRSITTGLMETTNVQGGQVGSIQERLDRIERRLELTEG